MMQVAPAPTQIYERCPCDGCPHAVRCRQGLACAAFESFINFGGRRWRAEPKNPSAGVYARVFGRATALA
jgi:hypothetical protein